TAGVAVIEVGAGSDDDLIAAIDDLLPADGRWRHAHGSPGHGRDHVLPAFISPSLTVPVVDGQPALGTWQSIVLVDTNRDNPHRRVRFSFLSCSPGEGARSPHRERSSPGRPTGSDLGSTPPLSASRGRSRPRSGAGPDELRASLRPAP